jgi:LPXTG-motif cell wall-anchored protein
MLVLVPTVVLAQQALTVHLEPMNGSAVSGTIVLTPNGDATEATLDLAGLPAGAAGTATLYANTCELPSASFAPVASFTADANGNVHATGRVLFRDTDVAFADISDGGRVIAIQSGGQVVACGNVPALASPALPNTGGALDSGSFAILGMFGCLVLITGLVMMRRAWA